MKQRILFFGLILFLFSCKLMDKKKEKSTTAKQVSFSVTETPFGTYEGKLVTEYTMTNPGGMQVSIINYGGTLTRIRVPDKSGTMGDVIAGFENLDGYLQQSNPYFGALVGRYANRIGGSTFTLEGKKYSLAANDHGNSLHGGAKGFDKVYWNIEKQPGDSSLKLTYTSPDGEEGYPGNLQVTVFYRLGSDNALHIEYNAETDKATPVNLTSHAYFNLSGGTDSTILGHELQLIAPSFTPVDEKLIPTGEIRSVEGTPMDFRSGKLIGQDIDRVPGGFDHNWVLGKSPGELSKAAVLYHPGSGRQMEVFTTEPGIQFYSGNFLDRSLVHTRNGMVYVLHGALCLETQHYPDSPNKPAFPSTILKPGETYRHTCIYKFSTR